MQSFYFLFPCYQFFGKFLFEIAANCFKSLKKKCKHALRSPDNNIFFDYCCLFLLNFGKITVHFFFLKKKKTSLQIVTVAVAAV